MSSSAVREKVPPAEKTIDTIGEVQRPASDRPALAKRASSATEPPLYVQTSGSNVVLVRRRKQKDVGAWKQLARWFVDNQIGLSFNLLALLFLAHWFIPKARIHTIKFFALSYYNPASGKYAAGLDDGYLIAFYIVLFTGLRAFAMEYLLNPFGRWLGLTKPKELTRFSEQAWLLLYYCVFWTIGVYIYSTSSYWLNMRELWTHWPEREIAGLVKGYVLGQWSFWLQQVIVINIEERRKDHWQMLSHHFITIVLLSSCYSYHHTKVGTMILVIMDVVDLFLPLAKCLKYAGFSTLCDVMFGIFMVSWFAARHVIYITVLWSVYNDSTTIITPACYRGGAAALEGPFPRPAGYRHFLEPYLNATGTVCYDDAVKWGFLAPLLALQGLTIAWFVMIVRVAVRVLRGDGADDVRSDDEGEEGEEEDEEVEEEFVYEEAQPLEEEVGVEELDLRGWERRAGVKRQAASSGVSLPGHSDRKELLGRIGCEKQVD